MAGEQDPTAGPQEPTQEPGQEPGQGEMPKSWGEVLETLPEGAQGLYEEHTAGLKTALETERDQRKDLAKQLQKASQQLEEGSEVRQELEQLSAKLEEAERRTTFYEEAIAEGVVRPKLAYLAALEAEAFDRRGNVDWEGLKEQFPELFRRATPPPGNAGAGTGGQPTGDFDMDQAIRQAARRT